MSSLGALNPINDPQAWDYLIIAGNVTPGIIPPGGVKGFKRTAKFDKKLGKGVRGATTTLAQQPPAEGSITFQLWTVEQYSAWDRMLVLLKYDPTKTAIQAYDVFHPALDAIDVNSVLISDIDAPDHHGDGLTEITVSFEEYFPPVNKSASSTATTSKPTVRQGGLPAGKPPDPPPPAEVTAESLLKTLQENAKKPIS